MLEVIVNWLKRPENTIAVSLAVVVLILHLITIVRVDDFIYDEDSYITEANYVLHGADLAEIYVAHGEKIGFTYEDYVEKGYSQHMPLGKLFIAGGIAICGDNVWGWRIGSVLCGVANIILFYLICQSLTSKRWLPLIAGFIFAFENMVFVLSGLAMIEVFALTMLLVSFLLYLKCRYIWTGVFLALAVLCKFSAMFGIGVVVMHWLLVRWDSNLAGLRIVIVSVLSFFVLLPLFDYLAVRELIYPWDRISFMFESHDDSTLANSPEAYRLLFGAILPWEWITVPKMVKLWSNPLYQLNVNWTLWIMIVPSMVYTLFESVRNRTNSLCVFITLWFICGYLPWFGVYWVFDRVSYQYYFYPVIGSLCLALGYMIYRLMTFANERIHLASRWALRIPVILWIAVNFIMFWLMAPIL